MKVIKTYEGNANVKPLQKIEYDHTDVNEFIKRFGLPKAMAEELCCYLLENNKVVTVNETYDAQSGWRGFEFIIDKTDLSVNGYCFCARNVQNFLWDNYKNHE